MKYNVEIASTPTSSKSITKKAEKALENILSSKELERNSSAENMIDECCRKAGVTTDVVYGVLSDGLKATYPMQDKFGEIHIIEDFSTQHKFMLTALELMKHLKDKTVIAQLGIFNDPSIEQDAMRVLALRDKK